MKKTLRFLSKAALVLMGAIMTGCTSGELVEEQPEIKSKTVTLTTTVSLDVATKALTATGEKTFAKDDQIAVVYKKSGGATAVAVSEKLPDGTSGSSATFTVTLDDPDRTQEVTYIYPAAMAKTDGTPNYDDLYTQQDGTLDKLASKFDYCTKSGAWTTAGALPSLTLENQLAILVLTLKNDAGGSEITSSITGLTVSDGSNNYNITRSVGAGPIYVAIRPTTSATIEVTATDGTKTYVKSLSDKAYANNNGYNLSWRMAEVIKGKFSVSPTQQVYFSKGNLRASKNSSWSWSFAPNQLSYVGNASANTNIDGDGSMNVSSDYLYVDLFGWSTDARHFGISNNTNNSYYSGEFVDWGSVDEVKAGIGSDWYTLESTKWRYLFKTRSTTSGIRYTKASIDGAYGIILLPDDWNTEYYTLNSKYLNDNCAEVGFAACNVITSENWTNKLEAHGAVFLRAAGQRDGQTVSYDNGRGYYWSCNEYNDVSGIRLYFAGNEVSPDAGGGKHFGYSVRLVRNVR